MSAEIKNIAPTEVWSRFAALNAVPRASKREARVIQFIKEFGTSINLPVYIDEAGNVIIRKSATNGMENRKGIVLQSHLDMVHQKNNDVTFDFENEGISMYIDGDWVRARGTTLGADNGLGVASIMAVLASDEIAHPDIEALFTVDEETGMTGAMGLKAGVLNGEILLNLDTEEDDEIDIGCAGGIDVTAIKKYRQVACPSINHGKKIIVKGLQGGHSGMDIHKGLGNANKIMNRILQKICVEYGVMVASIDGGSLRNAIPRESVVITSVHPDFSTSLNSGFEQIKSEILSEYSYLEPTLQILMEDTDAPLLAMDAIEEITMVKAISAAHNGVFRMSPDIENLVEASNNVARVEVKDGQASILCLSRSSVESSKTDVATSLKSVFELAGFEVTFSGAYPGWTPNIHSPILKVLKDIYEKQNNKLPNVVACHAGLECGILGKNYPTMDMISFGPTIKGAHSPDERASIGSFQKFWKFLLEVLKNIPEK